MPPWIPVTPEPLTPELARYIAGVSRVNHARMTDTDRTEALDRLEADYLKATA